MTYIPSYKYLYKSEDYNITISRDYHNRFTIELSTFGIVEIPLELFDLIEYYEYIETEAKSYSRGCWIRFYIKDDINPIDVLEKLQEKGLIKLDQHKWRDIQKWISSIIMS